MNAIHKMMTVRKSGGSLAVAHPLLDTLHKCFPAEEPPDFGKLKSVLEGILSELTQTSGKVSNTEVRIASKYMVIEQ